MAQISFPEDRVLEILGAGGWRRSVKLPQELPEDLEVEPADPLTCVSQPYRPYTEWLWARRSAGFARRTEMEGLGEGAENYCILAQSTLPINLARVLDDTSAFLIPRLSAEGGTKSTFPPAFCCGPSRRS